LCTARPPLFPCHHLHSVRISPPVALRCGGVRSPSLGVRNWSSVDRLIDLFQFLVPLSLQRFAQSHFFLTGCGNPHARLYGIASPPVVFLNKWVLLRQRSPSLLPLKALSVCARRGGSRPPGVPLGLVFTNPWQLSFPGADCRDFSQPFLVLTLFPLFSFQQTSVFRISRILRNFPLIFVRFRFSLGKSFLSVPCLI